MRRLLLCLSYKGTNYHGFQIQNNGNSVQGELEKAIKQITNENITVFPSGRTDAGVHALKQYVHFDTNSNIKCQNLVNALNTFLPVDIKVNDITEVDDTFHARYNVKKKTYMYVLYKGKVLNPLVADLVAPLEYKIDIEKVRMAKELLKGEHNFKAFCSSGTSVTDFVRTIYDISLEEKDDYIIIKVTGNGFLYNMVRIIVGTLVDIGRGKLEPSIIEKMLQTGDRSLGGSTAKGQGLYLYNVEY